MGKASRLKQERKAAAAAQMQQVISKASETSQADKSTMDDMLIVMLLISSIEMDNVHNFIAAVAMLEACGSDIYNFNIHYVDEDQDLHKDTNLLGYALIQGATDVVAWLIKQGLIDQDPATEYRFTSLMFAIDNGDYPPSAMDRYECLLKKVMRPASKEDAQKCLETPFTAEALNKRSVQIALATAHEFFSA